MRLRLPRRRTLAKVAALLVAGAVVNVGVAWGISWRFRDYGGSESVEPTSSGWPTERPAHWPAPTRVFRKDASNRPWRVAGFDRHEAFVEGTDSRYPRGFNGDDWWYVVIDVYSGAPFRSMRYFVIEQGFEPVHLAMNPRVEYSLSHGIPTRTVWRNACGALPLHLIPLGFFANTAFYAGVIWGGVGVSVAALRRHRRNRGLCPSCGYDTSGLTDCPECGAAGKD